MKKILITGAAGFIGYHLARNLLSRSDVRLALIDNLSRGKMDDEFKELIKDKRVQFLNTDLTREGSLEEIGGGFDHVYHLAAVNGTKNFYTMPHEVLRINILTLMEVLRWMVKHNRSGKLLFTSSNEAYAGALEAFGNLPLPTPEDVPFVIADLKNPRWSYGATKMIGEFLVAYYAKHYGFRAVIVRPHNFYGPRAGFDHVIPEFCLRIAQQPDTFEIFGADQTRSFCFIDDAVEALRLLMESDYPEEELPHVFHIGSSEEVAIRELAELLFDVSGWKPKSVAVREAPEGSVRRRVSDVRKIKNMIGWEARTPLREGLSATYAWYSLKRKD